MIYMWWFQLERKVIEKISELPLLGRMIVLEWVRQSDDHSADQMYKRRSPRHCMVEMGFGRGDAKVEQLADRHPHPSVDPSKEDNRSLVQTSRYPPISMKLCRIDAADASAARGKSFHGSYA